MMPTAPKTTSKRICRPTNGEPPGPVASTVAVPVCPEHRLVPQSSPLGANVSALKMGESLTVTATVLVCPAESCTVIVTSVSVSTLLGSRTIVLPATFCATGSTVEFELNAKKGATPEVIVTVAGTPA